MAKLYGILNRIFGDLVEMMKKLALPNTCVAAPFCNAAQLLKHFDNLSIRHKL